MICWKDGHVYRRGYLLREPQSLFQPIIIIFAVSFPDASALSAPRIHNERDEADRFRLIQRRSAWSRDVPPGSLRVPKDRTSSPSGTTRFHVHSPRRCPACLSRTPASPGDPAWRSCLQWPSWATPSYLATDRKTLDGWCSMSVGNTRVTSARVRKTNVGLHTRRQTSKYRTEKLYAALILSRYVCLL